MEAKREEIDLKLWSNGATLDEGLKLLRSIINELKRKLPKKFEITMKETRSNPPYASKILDEKKGDLGSIQKHRFRKGT